MQIIQWQQNTFLKDTEPTIIDQLKNTGVNIQVLRD